MRDLDYERWLNRQEIHQRTERLKCVDAWLTASCAVAETLSALMILHGLPLACVTGWWGVPLAGVLLALAGSEGRKWMRRARWELNLPG